MRFSSDFKKNFLFSRFYIKNFSQNADEALFFNKKFFLRIFENLQKNGFLVKSGHFLDLRTFDFVAIVWPCSLEPRRVSGQGRARYSRVTSLSKLHSPSVIGVQFEQVKSSGYYSQRRNAYHRGEDCTQGSTGALGGEVCILRTNPPVGLTTKRHQQGALYAHNAPGCASSTLWVCA